LTLDSWLEMKSEQKMKLLRKLKRIIHGDSISIDEAAIRKWKMKNELWHLK
jgi:hypothetical protein